MTIGLADRTAALDSAARSGEGRLPVSMVDEARAVVRRVRERAGLSADHTVVALAGSTGSGKSSVFNALAGEDLAQVGVQRPTTSHALAAVWTRRDVGSARRGTTGRAGGENPGPGRGGFTGHDAHASADAGPLLDWLEVPRRHDLAVAPDVATGLVLLDLPDHDSVVTEHRVRAERLVERADLLVWVVDPQKYADAALHERYLRPLAGHGAVVVVVLNQIDRLEARDAEACLADLRRLVALDGLDGARVLGVSAVTGQGMSELRSLLADAAARREAANARLVADVRGVARRIADACGALASDRGDQRRRAALVDGLELAAGVPTVVGAVRASAARDARAATGWPVTRWIGRFRADPLRRLGLRPRDGAPSRPEDTLARSSLPTVPAAVRAGTQSAVRDYVRAATQGIPEAWALAAHEGAREGARDLADALDQAVTSTVLDVGRRPAWWRAVGVVQWVLLALAVLGLLWLGVLAGLVYLRLPEPPTPTWGELPVPTVLAAGGVLAGVLLALVARLLGAVGAQRRAAVARRRLRRAIGEVADRLVRLPVGGELSALRRCRSAALVAAS